MATPKNSRSAKRGNGKAPSHREKTPQPAPAGNFNSTTQPLLFLLTLIVGLLLLASLMLFEIGQPFFGDGNPALWGDKGWLQNLEITTEADLSNPMGKLGATIALVLMAGLNMPQAREVLLDAVMDPMIADSFKAGILQILAAGEGFKPYDVDFGGRLVRLAAGGVSEKPVRGGEINQKTVQRACDALAPDFPDAPQVLLPVFLGYLKRYGAPKGVREDACAAALEYTYHLKAGREVDPGVIAGRYGVSVRQCVMYARRMMDAETEVHEDKHE